MRSAASSASSCASGRMSGLDTLNTLEIDDARLDALGRHLEYAGGRTRVAADMARRLEPAPLEPARVLPQARRRRRGVPLVDAARVEDEPAAGAVDEGAVGVAEDDHVGAWKLAAELC